MPRRFRRILALLVALSAAGAAMIAFAPLSAAQRSSAMRRAAATLGPSPIVGLIDGTAQWQNNAPMSHRMDQVLDTSDTKWIREGFYWSQIEPKPGVFTFAHYDELVTLAARRGVHVFVELYMAPRWAGRTSTSVPADPSAYAAFVAAVVARYGPGGTFWAAHPGLPSDTVQTFEIWHEAYYSNGDAGHYDPGRYARLVQAAVTAGRAANPAARFLINAEMQGEFVGSGAKRTWMWWVDALYKAVPDLNNYFDGVSVHPYGHDITHRSPAIPGRQYFGFDQMRRIEIIRKQFVAHGAADKPFWATEVGWPTCKHGSDRCVSPAGQRKSLDTLMRYAETRWKSYVRAVFVYYFNDLGRNTANPDNDYGLIYFNRKPKLVLPAFQAFAKLSPTASPWP
jgi:hypothetical protein